MRKPRASLVAIILAMVATGVSAPSAGALTPTEINARIKSLKTTLRVLAQDLDHAEHELADAETQIKTHTKALSEAVARRTELRAAIAQHASNLYIYGTLSDVDVVSDGIGTYIDQMAYLDQIRRGEIGLLEEVTAVQARADEESAILRVQRMKSLTLRNHLRSRQSSLSSQLDELQRLQNFLGSTSRFIIRGSRGSGRGIICPVVGSNIPVPNFGDPRPGGPHTGIDIRANTGQYVRAVLPATVVDTPTGSWWGIGIVIRDLSGTEWAYAHLSARSVHVGQRVAAGEVMGRVGCTGNCYGPHLHFEWWPGGGDPRDPYSIVHQAC